MTAAVIAANLEGLERVVAAAAKAGAEVVVLPEFGLGGDYSAGAAAMASASSALSRAPLTVLWCRCRYSPKQKAHVDCRQHGSSSIERKNIMQIGQ